MLCRDCPYWKRPLGGEYHICVLAMIPNKVFSLPCDEGEEEVYKDEYTLDDLGYNWW